MRSSCGPEGSPPAGRFFGGGLCARHEDLKNALSGLITDEGYATALEQHLTSANGQLVGRADVSLTSSNMTGLHVDVSVVMPTSQSAIARGSAVKNDVAATEMEEAKMKKYAACRLKVTPL